MSLVISSVSSLSFADHCHVLKSSGGGWVHGPLAGVGVRSAITSLCRLLMTGTPSFPFDTLLVRTGEPLEDGLERPLEEDLALSTCKEEKDA